MSNGANDPTKMDTAHVTGQGYWSWTMTPGPTATQQGQWLDQAWTNWWPEQDDTQEGDMNSLGKWKGQVKCKCKGK